MDIKKTNLEISKLNNPIVFLFWIISYRDELTDYNLSILLRLFLKHHSTIALNYNLKEIFKNELTHFNSSWDVLNKFYKIIGKKMVLIMVIKKWYLVYDNKKFWQMNISEQNDYLQLMKDRFLAVFDNSKGGVSYINKLANLIKNKNSNRDFILEDAKNRLIIILNIFGNKLFQSLEIPLISLDDFYQLSNENLIGYFIIIYEKFLELLNQTIKLFDSYNLICIQQNNLLNPIIVNVNSKSIDSETEAEDIQLFCSTNK